jgi:hypothetical protein
MKQSKNIICLFGNVVGDEHMLPSHISIYVALLQLWSGSRFKNPFRIHREEVMKLSRIKSLATYHRCIKQLHARGLVSYSPSYDPYRGSLIQIIEHQEEVFEPVKVSAEAQSQFAIPDFFSVELYFLERDLSSSEARAFYNFYELQNWSISDNKPMTSWQAAARNWILKQQKQASLNNHITLSYEKY